MPRTTEEEDAEESGSDDENFNPDDYDDAYDSLRLAVNPLLPTLKKHLGNQAAMTLREKLLNLTPGLKEEMEATVEGVTQLVEALKKSWPDVPKSTWTDEQKASARGKTAIDAWESEVIDLEFNSGKMYFPLKEVVIKDEDDSEEDKDAIAEEEVTIKHFKELPYILASPDIVDIQKMIWEKVEEDCGGLTMLSTSSTPIMLKCFSESFGVVDSCFENKKLEEAFCTLFPTTEIMKSIPHWYHDFDSKKEITTTMAELNRLWNKVLAQSNAELAIEGPATLRNDLKTWVDELATDVKATTKKLEVL
jgi:hypothetical protein